MVTTSATEIEPFSTETTAVDILLCVISVLLCIFICTGNVMTILAILRTEALQTFSNVYVAGLAGADFLVGVSLILLALFMIPYLRLTLYFEHINLCVFMQGIVIGMIFTSVEHLCLISVERYLYIVKPYVYHRVMTKRVIATTMVIAWVLGVVYSVSPQFIYKPYGEVPLCDVTAVLPIEYLLYSNTAIYSIVIFVIIIMYVQILKMAFQQRNAIRAVTVVVAANGHNAKKAEEEAAKTRQATMKSIKFFLTVFGAYFVCITPMAICICLDFFFNVNAWVYRFFNLVALTNSGMNFIIYSVQNRNFRYAFLRMIPCLSARRYPTSPVTTSASK
ncbi:lysophosphatidic acid receptor 3-like [Aplysia californica]|uniref:Lysophosphatidic acid receptor 3-like n=1 Tax=Aplysia californica TaxID=6500 RepID=A0ABM0JJZ8_APLCA|nr:lysophosphatidic acid receptor 3-like [Aplysia californica]